MKITKKQLKTVVRNTLNEQFGGGYGDLYSHQGTVPLEQYAPDNKKIGEIGATIGYDSRYRQIMRVYYHPSDDSVTIEMTSTVAVGGRDYEGPGSGASQLEVIGLYNTGPGAKASDVARNVRGMIDANGDTIRSYGKPSKNFVWGKAYDRKSPRGISVQAAKWALDWIRSK